MVATLRADTILHRLWYDLRNQALFEESFRPDSTDIDLSLERMIWRIVHRYADLVGASPSPSPPPYAYALMDGLFQHALLRHTRRRRHRAADDLDAHVQAAAAVIPRPRNQVSAIAPGGTRHRRAVIPGRTR